MINGARDTREPQALALALPRAITAPPALHEHDLQGRRRGQREFGHVGDEDDVEQRVPLLCQLGAARSRRGKTTSAHTIAIRMTDERTTRSKGATTPVRMAFALR